MITPVIDLTQFDQPFTLSFQDIRLINEGDGILRLYTRHGIESGTANAITRPDVAGQILDLFTEMVKARINRQ